MESVAFSGALTEVLHLVGIGGCHKKGQDMVTATSSDTGLLNSMTGIQILDTLMASIRLRGIITPPDSKIIVQVSSQEAHSMGGSVTLTERRAVSSIPVKHKIKGTMGMHIISRVATPSDLASERT